MTRQTSPRSKRRAGHVGRKGRGRRGRRAAAAAKPARTSTLGPAESERVCASLRKLIEVYDVNEEPARTLNDQTTDRAVTLLLKDLDEAANGAYASALSWFATYLREDVPFPLKSTVPESKRLTGTLASKWTPVRGRLSLHEADEAEDALEAVVKRMPGTKAAERAARVLRQHRGAMFVVKAGESAELSATEAGAHSMPDPPPISDGGRDAPAHHAGLAAFVAALSARRSVREAREEARCASAT